VSHFLFPICYAFLYFIKKYAAYDDCSAGIKRFYVNIYHSFALIHILSYKLRVYILSIASHFRLVVREWRAVMIVDVSHGVLCMVLSNNEILEFHGTRCCSYKWTWDRVVAIGYHRLLSLVIPFLPRSWKRKWETRYARRHILGK